MKPIKWDGSREALYEIGSNFDVTQIGCLGDELRIYPCYNCSYRVEYGDKIYKDADGEPYIQEFKKGDKK